jgi:hypothetical protein
VHTCLVERVMAKWKWLIVPLIAEIEMTPPGGSWFEKKKV